MARRPRIELEGGLYHIIARGNNRQEIFHSDEDHKKFLSLIAVQKTKLPFFLYAYCLMTNHVHLLIERMTDDIGRIMQRVLTGYSQYYNRRHRNVGHVFQGRHKAILCQSDKYLGELVRYIHLNPVRAKMVRKAERYPFSSQRVYLGMEANTLVDVDPVLRLFGARKQKARENFAQFVAAGAKLGHIEEFYAAGEGNILGSDEFVDEAIHRVGGSERAVRPGDRRKVTPAMIDKERLVASVETVCKISREQFTGPTKSASAVLGKEAAIIVGRRMGISARMLGDLLEISPSNVSRRHDAAIRKLREKGPLSEIVAEVTDAYSDPKL